MSVVNARRFLLVNAYSARNAGDAAINVATAELLREHGQLTMASRYASEDAGFYDDREISVVGPPIPFPPRGVVPNWLRFVTLLTGTIGAICLAMVFRLSPNAGVQFARWLRMDGMESLFRADRVVMCGGGYLYSARRLLNLTMVHVALTSVITKIAGLPLLMMPQSIGPLRGPLDRFMVRAAVTGVPILLVRDAASARTARDLRLRTPIQLVPDVAFWLGRSKVPTPEVERPASETSKPARPKFSVVCMDWTWARPVGPTALDDYLERLAGVVRALVAHGGDVILTGMSAVGSHGQDDLAIAERLRLRLDGLGPAVTVAGPETLDDISEILGSSSVVVGTRLHSCIIAMTLGVPAIALGYQPKAAGTYDLLGLSDLCFDVEHFATSRVAALAMEIASNRPAWVDLVRSRTERACLELDEVISGMIRAEYE